MMQPANGYTLMEVMITITLVGILAAFAMPNYSRSVTKSLERDAVLQLSLLHTASELYNQQAEEYLDNGGTPLQQTQTIDTINTNFNLNIVATQVTYTYDRSTASTYEADATRVGGAAPFTIRLNQNTLNTDATPPNPCCVTTNNCLTVDNCV